MEKPFNPSFDSQFFPVVHHVLKTFFNEYNQQQSEKVIGVKGYKNKFRFVVNWQDENQSSFDIFRIIEDEPKETENVI